MDVPEHEAEGTGYARVDTSVSCLLTRFKLRSAWSLVRFYRTFRRVRRDADTVPGLITSLFLVEDLRTCYTLSLWATPSSIRQFNTDTRAHIRAANKSFKDLEFGPDGPELWSAQFRLSAVSPHICAGSQSI